MGWFPGYAIDVNTGKRLNMIFSENSWLLGENGADMIWNPTSNFADQVGNPLFGGMHYVYVIGEDVNGSDSPAYDGGNWLAEKLDMSVSSSIRNQNFYAAWRSCMWVLEPMVLEGASLMDTDAEINLRVEKPYEERVTDGSNNGRPLYQFTIDNPTEKIQNDHLVSVLDNINVVPNPYYAYSEYETSKLDNRVKIVNLPERCKIKIFNMQGALVREFVKDDPMTSIDWDLKNHSSIPIAGGLYIIHIEVEIYDTQPVGTTAGIGLNTYERIIKWYGALRPPDLDNL
jgi:hypothetical protein